MSIHVTVATVIPHKDRFLLIRETSPNRPEAEVLNQPAGHVEPGEGLVAAAIRETLEETGWLCSIDYCIGLYHYLSPASQTQYIRACFAATLIEQRFKSAPDPSILQSQWLTLEEVEYVLSQDATHDQKDNQAHKAHINTQALEPLQPAKKLVLRSPIVLNCIKDFLADQRIPWPCVSEHGVKKPHPPRQQKPVAVKAPKLSQSTP